MVSNEIIIKELIHTLLSQEKLNLTSITVLLERSPDLQNLFDLFTTQNGSMLNLIIDREESYNHQEQIGEFIYKFSSYLDLNSVDKNGNTTLHLISQRNLLKLAGIIFEHDLPIKTLPDFYKKNPQGRSPLDVASKEMNPIIFTAMQRDFLHHRIVAVHPLQPANSILNFLYDTGKDNLIVYEERSGWEPDAIQSLGKALLEDDTLLSNDAVVGTHLAFADTLYTDAFVDRPHTHWWWNGLFQANSGGDWEDSLVAYIEPLGQFNTIYGCAPYDTIIMGPHSLSKHSSIIVPQIWADALSARLKHYEGKIIGFDPEKETLRQVINRTIKQHYPTTFLLTNQYAQDVNENPVSNGKRLFFDHVNQLDYNTSAGYFKKLYFSADSQSEHIPLMEKDRTIIFSPYKEFANGKFVGLHSQSPTDNEADKRIKGLKEVSLKPLKITDARFKGMLIGQTDHPLYEQLCITKCFETYKKLMQFSPGTGADHYAIYLLKKGLIADFRSIHAQSNSIPLQFNQLKSMVEGNFDEILSQLENMYQFKHASGTLEYRSLMEKIYITQISLEEEQSPDASVNKNIEPNGIASVESIEDTTAPSMATSIYNFWENNKTGLITGGVVLGLGAVVAANYSSKTNKF